MTIDLSKLIDLDLLSYFKSKLDTLFATTWQTDWKS